MVGETLVILNWSNAIIKVLYWVHITCWCMTDLKKLMHHCWVKPTQGVDWLSECHYQFDNWWTVNPGPRWQWIDIKIRHIRWKKTWKSMVIGIHSVHHCLWVPLIGEANSILSHCQVVVIGDKEPPGFALMLRFYGNQCSFGMKKQVKNIFYTICIRYAVNREDAIVRDVGGRLFPPYCLNLYFIGNWYEYR